MSPAFTTRRRADDFDRLVEADRRGAPVTGPVSTELADLAAFAAALREMPEVAPRPAFSADLRERLMAAAATELTPAVASVNDRLTVRATPTARRRRERRLTAGIAAVAIIGASAGTALASQSALPGEPLYPVKRAIENVRAGFTTNDSAKGAALLSDAHNRLSEASQLSHGSDNSAQISQTLDAFASQAKKASDLLLSNYQQHQDPASIDKLQQFTSTSIDQLTALEPLLPDGAKQALTSAAQTVLMIDSAAHNACPSCGGNPITSLPESLLSPVSTTVSSLGKALQPKAPSSSSSSGSTSTGKSQQTVKLPSVPSTLGPATVDSTGKATPKPPTPGQVVGSVTDPIKKILPPKPTTKPTTPGQVVGSTVGGVTGTVGGVLDSVTGLSNGLSDGLLGGGSSTAP